MRAPVERIEPRLVADLIPYANNPRLHSEEQVAQIAASMREFGQAQLIISDEKGEIIAGHGRVLAAQRLKLKQLLVGVAVGWSDKQKRAYRIADNQIALSSRWDQGLLIAEVKALDGEQIDLSLLGFDEGYLAGLLADRGELADVSMAWGGMPEFQQADGERAFKSVMVHFKDQAAVEKFEKLIGRKLTNRYLWFPEIEVKVFRDKHYISKK